MSRDRTLELRGVRVHNLRDLDLDLPHNRLILITGPSGSGKSSLAFDTIYTEGQRRYTESLNPYVRQFLERMEKPDLDTAAGITPTVAVGRTPPPRSSRSTVATMTELADVVRLLFARLATLSCPDCGIEVRADHPDRVTAHLRSRLQTGQAPLLVTAPLAPAASSSQGEARVRSLLQEGYLRVLLGDRIGRLDRPDGKSAITAALLDDGFQRLRPRLVLDRLPASAARTRVREAVESAYSEGHGRLIVVGPDGGEDSFSEGYVCSSCGRSFPDPRPQLFSFNSPYGACPVCEGFGAIIVYLPEYVIPDPRLTLAEGAVEPWTKPAGRRWQKRLEEEAPAAGVRLDVPWEKLRREEQDLVWQGFGRFRGVEGYFQKLERKKYRMHIRVFLARYRSYVPCTACNGTRLRDESRMYELGGFNAGQVLGLTVTSARAWLDRIELDPEAGAVYVPIVAEAQARLAYLEEVGLGYLTLDRLSRTLSGGEAQRIALASVLGTVLVGTTYVLDEPSVGLHPRDVGRLLDIIRSLRDRGNTVIVVEHDRDLIAAADHVVDLGPGSGEKGGRIVYEGSIHGLLHEADTATGRYLQGRTGPPRQLRRRRPKKGWLRLEGVREHNLQELEVEIPRGLLTCLTGVSGSGKSTLLYDVLKPALERALELAPDPSPGSQPATAGRPGAYDRCTGYEGLTGIESVDQGPLGAGRRSNPATYLKAWDGIRKVFAATDQARRLGLEPGAFSFNTRGGRCPECEGVGTVTVDMQFMADVTLRCEACNGRRFTPRVLEVRYRGRNISDVLDLTVEQAISFFRSHAAVVRALRPLQRVGLGYLRLGQPASELSAGEAQRVKLAAHLRRRPGGEVLYLFDEPTTGLHGTEVGQLADCIEELVESGHTAIVIEHNMDLVARADWVIDLGPEGGEAGGRIVAQGRPEDVVAEPDSYTGRALETALTRLTPIKDRTGKECRG